MKHACFLLLVLLLTGSALNAYWDGEWDITPVNDRYSPEALNKALAGETSVPKILALGLIRLYQLTLSGKTGGECNFYPSCSRYGFTAVKKFGAIKGSIMAIDRIMRCNWYAYTAGYPIDYEHGLLSDSVESNDTLNFIFDWLNF